MAEEKVENEVHAVEWAFAVHSLGWNIEKTGVCEVDGGIDLADFVAYTTLCDAIKNEQFSLLRPVVFVMRVPALDTDKPKSLVIGELIAMRSDIDWDSRLPDFKLVLERTLDTEMRSAYPWLINNLTFVQPSIWRPARTCAHAGEINAWFLEQINARGGKLSQEHPQDNYSHWFGKVYSWETRDYVPEASLYLASAWGTVDLLEAYSGYAYGTNQFPLHMGSYPNVVYNSIAIPEENRSTMEGMVERLHYERIWLNEHPKLPDPKSRDLGD